MSSNNDSSRAGFKTLSYFLGYLQGFLSPVRAFASKVFQNQNNPVNETGRNQINSSNSVAEPNENFKDLCSKAIQKGNLEELERLFNSSEVDFAKSRVDDLKHYLDIAFNGNNQVLAEYVLKKYIENIEKNDKKGISELPKYLIKAVDKSWKDVVKVIVNLKYIEKFSDDHAQKLLYWLIKQDNEDIFDSIIKKLPEGFDAQKFLVEAIHYNKPWIIEGFHKNNFNIYEAKTEDNYDLLKYSAGTDCFEIVKYLVDNLPTDKIDLMNNYEINKKGVHTSALSQAVYNVKPEIVEFLIKRGAKIINDQNQVYVIRPARDEDNNYKKNVAKINNLLFWGAVKEGSYEHAFHYLKQSPDLEQSPDVNFKPEGENSSLEIVLEGSREDLAQLIINRHIDCSREFNIADNLSIFYQVIDKGWYDVFELLVKKIDLGERGSDLNTYIINLTIDESFKEKMVSMIAERQVRRRGGDIILADYGGDLQHKVIQQASNQVAIFSQANLIKKIRESSQSNGFNSNSLPTQIESFYESWQNERQSDLPDQNFINKIREDFKEVTEYFQKKIPGLNIAAISQEVKYDMNKFEEAKTEIMNQGLNGPIDEDYIKKNYPARFIESGYLIHNLAKHSLVAKANVREFMAGYSKYIASLSRMLEEAESLEDEGLKKQHKVEVETYLQAFPSTINSEYACLGGANGVLERFLSNILSTDLEVKIHNQVVDEYYEKLRPSVFVGNQVHILGFLNHLLGIDSKDRNFDVPYQDIPAAQGWKFVRDYRSNFNNKIDDFFTKVNSYFLKLQEEYNDVNNLDCLTKIKNGLKSFFEQDGVNIEISENIFIEIDQEDGELGFVKDISAKLKESFPISNNQDHSDYFTKYLPNDDITNPLLIDKIADLAKSKNPEEQEVGLNAIKILGDRFKGNDTLHFLAVLSKIGFIDNIQANKYRGALKEENPLLLPIFDKILEMRKKHLDSYHKLGFKSEDELAKIAKLYYDKFSDSQNTISNLESDNNLRQELIPLCYPTEESDYNILKSAIVNNNLKLLNFLLDGPEKFYDKLKFYPLVYTILNSDSDQVLSKILQKTSKSIFRTHELNKALLLGTIAGKNLETLNLLVSSGADVNVKDDNGFPLFHRVIESNKQEVINFLLNKEINIKAKNNNGESAFHIAVKKSNIELIEILIDKGADPYYDVDNENKTPLSIASEDIKNNILSCLEKKKSRDNELKKHAILSAILNPDLDTLEKNLEPLVNDLSGKEWINFFWHAIDLNDNIILNFLTQKFAQSNSKNEVIKGTDFIGLLNTAIFDKRSIAESLIRNCVDKKWLNSLDENSSSNGYNLLYLSSISSNDSAFNQLINLGARLIGSDKSHLLHNAIRDNDNNTVDFLIKNCVKVDHIEYKSAKSALQIAMDCNQLEIAETLIKHGADIQLNESNNNSNRVFLKNLIKSKPDILNCRSNKDQSTLMCKIITYLPKEMIDDVFQPLLSQENKEFTLKPSSEQENNNILCLALEKCNDKTYEWLVKITPSCKTLNNQGYAPIHLAIIKGHQNKALSLIERDETLKTLKDKDKKTPLQLAIESCSLSVIQSLKPTENTEFFYNENQSKVDLPIKGSDQDVTDFLYKPGFSSDLKKSEHVNYLAANSDLDSNPVPLNRRKPQYSSPAVTKNEIDLSEVTKQINKLIVQELESNETCSIQGSFFNVFSEMIPSELSPVQKYKVIEGLNQVQSDNDAFSTSRIISAAISKLKRVNQEALDKKLLELMNQGPQVDTEKYLNSIDELLNCGAVFFKNKTQSISINLGAGSVNSYRDKAGYDIIKNTKNHNLLKILHDNGGMGHEAFKKALDKINGDKLLIETFQKDFECSDIITGHLASNQPLKAPSYSPVNAKAVIVPSPLIKA